MHSFWIRDGEEMSKRMGNFVSLDDLRAMLGVYGLDALRFFLIARGPNLASNTDFSAARLHETYTSDLANTVGNCCARVTAMVARYCRGGIPEMQTDSGFPIVQATALVDKARNAAINDDVSALADGAIALFRLTDVYIHQAVPLRLAKEATQRSHDALEAIHLASLLLWAIMPQRMRTVWAAIGSDQSSSALSRSAHAGSDAHFRWGAAPFARAVSAETHTARQPSTGSTSPRDGLMLGRVSMFPFSCIDPSFLSSNPAISSIPGIPSEVE